MRRREFITLVGGAAAAWPLAARAQQSAKPVVGFMHATAQPNDVFVTAFKEGLSQTGYVDGRNVTIEFRSAEGQYDRLPAIAAEFVQRRVNVIAAGTPVAALAAKRGERSKASLKGASRQMANSMSEQQLDDFAKTRRKA